MLKKLLKYEWKSTNKIGGLLMLTGVGIGILGCLTILIVSNFINNDAAIAGFGALLGIMALVVFALCLVSIIYGGFIYLGVKFYKSMYGDEGYLMHTLPVTTHQLLLSKTIIAGIWSFLFSFLVVLVYIGFGSTVAAVSGADLGEALGILFRGFAEAFGEMDLDDKLLFIAIIVMYIISFFTGMTALFGCFTVGQLFRKHRGIMGLLCYVLFLVVNWFASMICNTALFLGEFGGRYDSELYHTADPFTYVLARMALGMLLNILMGVGMYFVAYYINEKKLNLE